MKKMGYKWGIMLVGLLLLITLVGCSDESTKEEKEEKVEKDEIVIGVTNPLSGALAEMGQDNQEGIKLAIELKNKEGGINGKQIRIVEADVPEATAAKTEAERLIDKEKVDLIIGTYGSSISLAISEVTARKNIPYFEVVSLSNSISNRGYKNVYRINPNADKFAVVAMDALQNVIPQKLGKDFKDLKVVLIHEDTDNGTSWMDAFEEIMEAEGLEDVIKMRESYSAQTNDMSSLILKVKNAEPDAVVAVSYLNDAIQFVRQSKELGVNYPVLMGGGSGWGQPGLQEAVGNLTEGILDIEYPPLPPLSNAEAMPGIETYITEYESVYNEEPESLYGHSSFASTNTILEILENAESVSAEDIEVAAYSVDKEWWTTASGWGAKFEQEGEFIGQNSRTAPYLTQWIDGKLTVVAPEEISVIEPVIPKPDWK